MRRALLAIALAACGGSDGPKDAPLPPCDYTEAADATNDHQAELTALAVGDTTKNLCGSIDAGHFDAPSSLVDTDTYRVTLAAPADLLVRSFAHDPVAADVSVMIFDTQANPTLLNGSRIDPALGDHGVFVTSLAPGDYDVVVTVRATAALAAPVSYKVRLIPDAADMRCPAIMTAAAYTEAHDNADNLGNDMVDVDFTKTPSFTPTPANDAAEPTKLTLADKPLRISGSSANSTGADQYLDRDTFQLTTGDDTDEIALRLDWSAGGADLDAVMFVDSQMVSPGATTRSGTSGDEIATFAVQPKTSYWLWVGGAKGSTGLPAAYDVSLCGASVNPDWR